MGGFTRESPSVQRVRGHLHRLGPLGATDSELEEALGLSRATVCAARKLLVDVGEAEWTGAKRRIPLGQPPKVWRKRAMSVMDRARAVHPPLGRAVTTDLIPEGATKVEAELAASGWAIVFATPGGPVRVAMDGERALKLVGLLAREIARRNNGQ